MKVYFDENISPYVADAINSMCKGYFPDVEAFSTVNIKELRRGATDTDIAHYIAKHNGVLITEDPDFRHSKVVNDICRDHKIGVFLLQLSKGEADHWTIIRILINNWVKIVDLMGSRSKPYWYKIQRRGITQMFPKG